MTTKNASTEINHRRSQQKRFTRTCKLFAFDWKFFENDLTQILNEMEHSMQSSVQNRDLNTSWAESRYANGITDLSISILN